MIKLSNKFKTMSNLKQIIKSFKVLKIMYTNYLKYRDYQNKNKKRKLIHKKGYELIEYIHNTLNSGNIKFFLDFGTLLGFVREKGFIKHDLDIDIGVIKQDDSTVNIVKRMLENSGCTLKFEYLFEGNIVEHSFLYEQIKFDISYYEQDELYSKCYLFYKDPEECLKYPDNKLSVVQMKYDKIDGIVTQRFGKRYFNIPVKAEKLLEQKYGYDWRTPNSKWIYWKSPSASKCNNFGIQQAFE